MTLTFSDEQRFQEKHSISLPEGCWEWLAGTNGRGYGVFRVRKKSILAHRVSYFRHHGKLPANKVVRHKCDNSLCVRPDHLELGTQADNMRDMSIRGRVRNQNTGRTHCQKGHPLTDGNILTAPSITGRGWRRCRTCNLAWRQLNRKRSA